MHIARAVRTVTLAVVGGLALVGCGTGEVHRSLYEQRQVAMPSGTVSVYNLASVLGLHLERIAPAGRSTAYYLRSPANRVVFVSDPDGRVIVNGQTLRAGGPLRFSDGILFVPREYVPSIRRRLRPDPVVRVEDPAPPREVPDERRPTRPRPRPVRGTVLLDAGHGGKDLGAVAVTGISEKWINLSIAKKVGRILEPYAVQVAYTRTSDATVSLKDRAEQANRLRPDLMVSFHADSFPKDRSVRGFNVYVAQGGSVRSFRAGQMIADNLRGAGRRVHGERALRRARYYVLLRTTCPAVLIEAGFLSNRADANLLNDRDQQDRIARAVAAAILEYLQED